MKYAVNPAPVYSYDPDKAAALWKKAGMEGKTVDLSASDAAFAGGVDAALLMAEQAKKAGININVVKEPNDSYWDNVWLKKDWCLCYWGGRPVADMFLSVSLAADALGTIRIGRTHASTSFFSLHVPKPMIPSALLNMPKLSSWCMMMAAKLFSCTTTTLAH
jgi:ABC-type transport system substrate-binding protein